MHGVWDSCRLNGQRIIILYYVVLSIWVLRMPCVVYGEKTDAPLSAGRLLKSFILVPV